VLPGLGAERSARGAHGHQRDGDQWDWLTAILTGTSVSVSYTEPVLSLPEDLQKTTITHQLGGGPSVFVMDVTATSPAGGGAIVQTFDVPVAPGFRQALTMSVMATNPSGTSSAALASKTVDRTAVSSSGIRR